MLRTDDNDRGARRILLQFFNAADEMGSVIGKVEKNYTEGFFLQALSGFLDIRRCTDAVIGCQGGGQISGFIFMLTDNQDPGGFIDFDL